MPGDFEIRKLPQSRWRDYRKIRLEGLKNDPQAFASSYEEEVEFAADVWVKRVHNAIFALIDDVPVGVITYIIPQRRKVKHTSDINGFYVSSEYRHRGIGTALLRKAISMIREVPGIRKVNLSVSATQIPAISMYYREGFVKVGEARDQFNVDGKFSNEVYMELFL